jgi:hypothetical protein
MAVLMVLRIPADVDSVQRVAQEHADEMRGVAERSKEYGAIRHGFYAGEGEVFVVDEWDSPESFQKFWEAEAPNIGPLMEAAGAQGEPGPPQFYTKMDTGTAF